MKIAFLLEQLEGMEVPYVALQDSLFEITGSKIRYTVQEKDKCCLNLTFYVRLRKD